MTNLQTDAHNWLMSGDSAGSPCDRGQEASERAVWPGNRLTNDPSFFFV